MIRFRGTVLYLDGSEEELHAGTASVAAWERYALRHNYPTGKDAPAALSDMVVAHHALAISEPFDPWAERVLSIEIKQEEDVPPTEPTASTVEP